MTSLKLKKLEEIVLPILERDEEARNDDFHLYSEVVAATHPEFLNVTFLDALRCHKVLGLPNYESVTRVRRKLQEKHPELESERAKKHRKKEEAEYREYAKTS